MSIEIIFLFIITFISSLLGLFVLFGKKDKINVIYSVFILFISAWSAGSAFFLLESNTREAIFIANFCYVAILGVLLFFTYFSPFFIDKNFHFKTKSVLLSLPFIIFVYFLIFDNNFLIRNISWQGFEKRILMDFKNYFLYLIYFLFLASISYFNLHRAYFKSNKNIEEKKRLLTIILSVFIIFIFGLILSLFLPFFGYYHYVFIGPFFMFGTLVVITCSIFRYNLFQIKTSVTEVIIFILWILLIVRVILMESFVDQVLNGGFLFMAIILGIILIQNVSEEIFFREDVQKLADDLKVANNSLQSANERLQEVDRLKSEFLSLATHQIRAPLSSIKGYASMILDGDYGELSPGVKGAVNIIFKSSQNLVTIVTDFLDISHIEQGKMKYEIVPFDMMKLVLDLVSELEPNVKKSGLSIALKAKRGNFIVRADPSKIKQILTNLIDNAIKYTKNGEITIGMKNVDSFVRLSVHDSGIGIDEEDLSKLFGKFVRAKNAYQASVVGTGLGLYIAKQMIIAQGGNIWAESKGINNGSTFCVEVPLAL